jgi:uncharacterized membrane protein (UPF0136 family)
MSPFVLLLYIYGILLIIGGFMGYIKAKSMVSLVAGVVCGVIALLLGFYYATFHFAPHAALLLALLLIFVMGRRYLNSRKVMPALVVVVLSVVVAIAQVYVIFSTPA